MAIQLHKFLDLLSDANVNFIEFDIKQDHGSTLHSFASTPSSKSFSLQTNGVSLTITDIPMISDIYIRKITIGETTYPGTFTYHIQDESFDEDIAYVIQDILTSL